MPARTDRMPALHRGALHAALVASALLVAVGSSARAQSATRAEISITADLAPGYGVADRATRRPVPPDTPGTRSEYSEIGYATGTRRRVPGGGPPMRLTAGGWVASALDMTLFLLRLAGEGGPPFLSQPMMEEMLARPAEHLVRANGSWFGLGWDAVRVDAAGAGDSKNGGLAGVATHFEHMAPDLDWTVFLNTGAGRMDDERGPRTAVVTAIRADLARRTSWPASDFWSRHRAHEDAREGALR